VFTYGTSVYKGEIGDFEVIRECIALNRQRAAQTFGIRLILLTAERTGICEFVHNRFSYYYSVFETL
jgi:hypothetical protein